MEVYKNPEPKDWATLQRRCQTRQNDITATVERLLADVREGGDHALREISQRFDGWAPDSFQVSQRVIEQAAESLSPELRSAIVAAKSNIEAFHSVQLPKEVEVETVAGVKCYQRAVPLQCVGLYIPGGKAPLFSTVLMLAIPAKIAGCKEVVLCTPPGKAGIINPAILYAASLCGIDKVYAIGGAQAVAAMAYGTESVPRVDKIFGPGNRFVTKAKQLVAAESVAIDMPAGPSEVMVMADGSANPSFVAADLLSQCEHGDDSQAILLCHDGAFALDVIKEIDRQKKLMTRRETIENSLANSRIVIFNIKDDMIEFANQYGSEHLIISMENPWHIANKITAAGSIFIGNYSPESAGDYASGTNHTLPTNGWARSHSGVNIDSFMRKITYQELTRDGLRALEETITIMANAEGLGAHANAVAVRMEGGKE